MGAVKQTETQMHPTKTVTILGINGHIGNAAARAFLDAGWQVTGFGRSNRHPIAGVRFHQGDADSIADMQAAIGKSEVVVNALNLPYHQWDNGRMEAQTEKVIAAMGTTGKTMLYPGNIYNYAASDRVVTPDLEQHPQTERGAIRVRSEALLRNAAATGAMQVIILRAGDFYGPNNQGDWFEVGMLREAAKGRVSVPGPLENGHSWAYLPDLGKAFEKLAWHRQEFGSFENFHFAGHFMTNRELLDTMLAEAPVPLTVTAFPWGMFKVVSLFMPLLREIMKMRYLWTNTMELSDPRLDAILGPDFGTPRAEAIRATIAPFFAEAGRKAA
jgi:nucleoside-diphosphate-sugar epimerase